MNINFTNLAIVFTVALKAIALIAIRGLKRENQTLKNGEQQIGKRGGEGSPSTSED